MNCNVYNKHALCCSGCERHRSDMQLQHSVMLRPRGQNIGLGLDQVRLGLGIVNLASKMCYSMKNYIGCIHFVVVSLQHSLQKTWLSTLMWDKKSVMCSGHVFYSEISTCGLGGLGLLALFNITGSITGTTQIESDNHRVCQEGENLVYSM